MTPQTAPLTAALKEFLSPDYPYTDITWVLRDAVITDGTGATIFEQKYVEAPETWSQTAVNIVASKYFHGQLGTPERENSVAQLVHRVVDTISEWGVKDGYFPSAEQQGFSNRLARLILEQKASFNSPVWFNVGVKNERRGSGWYFERMTQKVAPVIDQDKPQCSACFILSVQDNLASILDTVKTEGMLFKWGSGCGSNLSSLREENAPLSGGGKASGPLSFMKGFDAFAGIIKSGGTTRRAAKLVSLNVNHPDIEEFIWCKAKEEKKAHALIAAGYNSSFEGEAYSSITFQNANNSVRVTDDFMQAAADFGAELSWTLRSVVDGQPKKQVGARALLRQIAEATWLCGDPGMQFDTAINHWHTCPNSGRISAANPCIEYNFLDDSACNLASLNLMKFVAGNGEFDTTLFCEAVDTLITAQEILVDNSSYPTEKIAQNSHDYRPLGLGFANLGALLMSMGIAYDSHEGRDLAASIASLMSAQAYLTSSTLAHKMGPFPGYAKNSKPFLNVIKQHIDAAAPRNSRIGLVASRIWTDAYALGKSCGYRNAQVTVIAPTGTIGFMMDVSTTGIEPELALVKYKKLVGGGVMKIVNQTVSAALTRLSYSPSDIKKTLAYIDQTGTVEGASGVWDDHLPVFDCSFKPQNGTRSIAYMGHIKMMAAVQPFISGALSKTINMPEESTVEDIMEAYIQSWKLGLKAVAIYRDNSKGIQPLSTGGPKKEDKAVAQNAPIQMEAADMIAITAPVRPCGRRKMPNERNALTRKFSIAGHEGYITVGLYDDGTPGELFVTMAKEGSTISGLIDSFSIAISHCLQYGVPLQFLVDKYKNARFEPSGWTGEKDIPYAKSIVDFIFQWLEKKFPGTLAPPEPVWFPEDLAHESDAVNSVQSDAPLCSECGSLMQPNGSCFKCENCGGTSGCS